VPRRALSLWAGGLLAAACLALAGQPVRGAGAREGAGSLALVPADAAFYSAMLRNKEQFDALVKSKGFKRLMSLPLVKMGLEHLRTEMAKEDGPLAGWKKFMAVKENRALLQLLKDAVSHEIFFYGGRSWDDLLALLVKVNNARMFAAPEALFSGMDPMKAQARTALLVLQKNKELFKTPELVLGFKVKDTKEAEAQIERLEGLLTGLARKAEPLRGRIKRQKVGGRSFLTLTFDGNMIPWDEIPLKEFEDRAGEFDDLIKHVKDSKLTISLGVRQGYLMLGLTSTVKELARIGGKGKHLAERAEVKPLEKFADRKLASIGYISKAFRTRLAGTSGDVKSMTDGLKGLLAKADIPAAHRKNFEDDLDELAAMAAKAIPTLGAAFGFTFLTETGYEGYDYDYTKYPRLKGARFKLRSHLGGNPILALGGGSKTDGSAYANFSRFVKKVYGHAESFAMDKLDADQKEMYKKYSKIFLPLIGRIDQTTKKMLLPALKDASCAFVLDGKWTSKRWFQGMPPTGKAMPMPELALVVSLADATLFQKALREYRLIVNDILAKAHDAAPDNVQEVKIPAAESAKGKLGVYYYYNIPEEAGVDKQVVPTLGVGERVAAFTMSRAHARRLISVRNLKVKDGPLARKDLVALCYFDWPGFVDLVTPWIEFGVRMNFESRTAAGEGEAGKPKLKDVLETIRVVADVFKAFQNFSAGSYLEDGVLVTHHRTIIQDRPGTEKE
jgi:hypothetical protein